MGLAEASSNLISHLETLFTGLVSTPREHHVKIMSEHKTFCNVRIAMAEVEDELALIKQGINAAST